ncbi:hypothetical protein BDY24DRAFT_3781 [Mrakia frigida]|uniref:uncharacterized protein n=1 Tax=Mrakia frigida TaxID=29902 RepID=UPI003FCC154E
MTGSSRLSGRRRVSFPRGKEGRERVRSRGRGSLGEERAERGREQERERETDEEVCLPTTMRELRALRLFSTTWNTRAVVKKNFPGPAAVVKIFVKPKKNSGELARPNPRATPTPKWTFDPVSFFRLIPPSPPSLKPFSTTSIHSSSYTMSEEAVEIPTFPVASRVNGKHPDHPVPHVGPGLQDYKKFHAQTIGGKEGSDDWWRKVSRTSSTSPLLLFPSLSSLL